MRNPDRTLFLGVYLPDYVNAVDPVEADCSKHRREDVLPLHPEYVAMVRMWIEGVPEDEILFPELAKRRTWLMVKKDLERVGIAYETADGFADFHAAGRHSHITGLLRSGASLPEAQKLARHTDIKQTMKYAHIGIDDQAKAVSNLPALHGRCSLRVVGGPSMTPVVTSTEDQKRKNPCGNKGFGVSRHSLSAGVKMEAAGIESVSAMPKLLLQGALHVDKRYQGFVTALFREPR